MHKRLSDCCGKGGGGVGRGVALLCIFNAVVKGRLEFVLMFVLLSLHWFQATRNTNLK